jgi:hypothetical protein
MGYFIPSWISIPVFLFLFIIITFEACTTDTHSWLLTSEGTATVRRNHHGHLDRSLIDAQMGVSHLQRIPWAAA